MQMLECRRDGPELRNMDVQESKFEGVRMASGN